MTDEFTSRLKLLLVTSYRSILKIEEEFARRSGTLGVSAKEMHLLDAVATGRDGRRTVKEIAAAMHITQPSVTAAINRLEKKGCVERIRSTEDGRVVYIHLTRLGQKIHLLYMRFHENMVRTIARDLTEDEMASLLKGIKKLNEFFNGQISLISKATAEAEPKYEQLQLDRRP